MKRFVKFIGGLLIVIIAGAAGGAVSVVGVNILTCDMDAKCTIERLRFDSAIADSVPGDPCIDLAYAQLIRTDFATISGDQRDSGASELETLWGGQKCRQLKEVMDLVCRSIDGGATYRNTSFCESRLLSGQKSRG